MNNSIVNAAEKGCSVNNGIGRGQSSNGCAGSGGAHGGIGGYGLAVNGSNNELCSKFAPKPYTLTQQAKIEGSAGGSAYSNTLGSSGGGVIWISSTNTVQLNQTLITVQGGDGDYDAENCGAGGGAGGSVQIVTKNIAGDALINLKGGDGSIYGGGGGSGGRIVTSLLQSYNATNKDDQSLKWNGTINLDGGKGGRLTPGQHSHFTPDANLHILLVGKNLIDDEQVGGYGQAGVTTQSKCFGGFSGPFCKPCEVGTYKYNFGSGVCQPCSNKPINSYYIHNAQSSSECDYQCVDGIESVDVNPQCLSSLDLQVQRVGGASGTLFVVGMLFMFALLLWIIIVVRSGQIRRQTKDYYATVYDGVLFADQNDDYQDETEVGPASLQMRDSDIWSHSHRMYLIGENSISYPWYCAKDFPNNSLTEQNKEKLLKYIHKEQWTLDWSRCQSYYYYFIRVFFPYVADLVHRSVRRKHLRDASSKLYESFDQTFWEDITGRQVRLSTDEENRLAYLDFLDYRKNKGNYQGPQLPITLLLAGNGTLSTPYKLNFLNDPLAKSLVYLDKAKLKNKLPPFFQNLNTLLDKLCFYKFNRLTMKDLTDVIEWIELGNKTLFAPVGVKLCFYVFENSYQLLSDGSFRQRRRSMPLEKQVFDAFPSLFKRLIQHVQLKMLTKHSEIKFGIVVRPTSSELNKKMESKIRKISESLGGKNEEILSLIGKTSVSEIYEDEAIELSPKKTKKQKGPLGSLKTSRQLSEHLIEEDDMETSTVMIHGTNIETEVRIIDKSKRAYDWSIESTQALEKTLQKDRKQCKHSCARMKSVLYSLWIMMFKLHGKPPADNHNMWFILFSMSIALELVLDLVFILHIISPVSNVWSFGLPYLFILPGITVIAPFWGILGTIIGSPTMLKSFSTMNATMVVLNYPLTIFALWVYSSQVVYVAVVLMLILNKVFLSFFGSKVRQFFANPNFSKTQLKMRDTLSDMMIRNVSGTIQGVSPAERASMLVSSGNIARLSDDSDDEENRTQFWSQAGKSDGPSEKLLENKIKTEEKSPLSSEEEDSFGIVSTKKLRASQVEQTEDLIVRDLDMKQIIKDAAELESKDTTRGDSVVESEDM